MSDKSAPVASQTTSASPVRAPSPVPPTVRPVKGTALGLNQADVDFIQSLIQRTPHDRQSFHRLAALKEAYGRATSKQADPPRIPPIPRITLKNMPSANKIRDELEKYDQLPPRDFDSSYYEDETYTIENHPRAQPALHPWIVRSQRILDFLTSIKRRAQVNMQQWKKNLQDVRTRIFIEQATMPPARRRNHRPMVRLGCTSLSLSLLVLF